MRAVIALLLGLSFIAACESAKREPTDVFDGGEPLYIAECAKRLPGQACE